MLKAILTIFIIFIPLAAPAEKWKIEEHQLREHETVFYLRGATDEGYDSFRQAMEAVPEGAWIQFVRFGCGMWPEETKLPSEIYQYLEIHYPAELKDALASAGNLHNPKVKALVGPLAKAVLASSFVARLSRILDERCHRIVDVSSEKLIIFQGEEGPSFNALLWLRTERCTAPSE